MEAIAHSPSFAKKAGVPQSVGKDYAAADKGKTFKRGGEMKESKAMVGKEVAFMKKKGAPASMIKHEKAEMKGMKAGGKVRRYGAGGGPLGDESIMTDEEYAKQKEQGAKNWKSLKSFFNFGEKETPAPIDRSRDIGKKEGTKTRLISTPITETVTKISGQKNPAETSQAETTRAEPSFTQRIADQMLDREKGGSNYGADYGSDSYSDYGDNSGSSRQTFKPIGVETSEKRSRVITAPATAKPQNQPAKAESTEKRRFSSDSPDLESRAEEMKPRRKFGLASDETRSAVRKGLGSALDFFNLSKAHEREFGKKMAKGGKVKKMAMGGMNEMSVAQPPINNQPTNTQPVSQADMGFMAKKLASMPYRGGTGGTGGTGGVGSPMTPNVPVGVPQNPHKPTPMPVMETPKGIPKSVVKPAVVPSKPSMPVNHKTGKPYTQQELQQQLVDYKAKRGMSYTQAMAKENAAKRAKDAAAKKSLAPQQPELEEMKNQKINPFRGGDGGGFGGAERGGQRTSLPQEDYDIDGDSGGFGGGVGGAKRGGQVKKMASGGYTRAADGAAKKGKTQAKVVKMASGGFVKNADGCAQRGRTKAFQVKMKRGGMC